MLRLLRETGLYADGWTGKSVSISVESKVPVQFHFFLPANAQLSEGKSVHFFYNNQNITLNVLRGEASKTPFVTPIDDIASILVTCDEIEPFIGNDIRERGILFYKIGEVDLISDLFKSYFERVTSVFVKDTHQIEVSELVSKDRFNSVTQYIEVSEENRAKIEPLFDKEFYRSGFHERDSPTDPIGHYLTVGHQEGRNPAPWFSGYHYLAMHMDVAAVKINPFLHYCIAGHQERRALPQMGGVPFAKRGPNGLFRANTKFTAMDQNSGIKCSESIPELKFSDILEDFVPFKPYDPILTVPRTIAFYLPQFHPFPENDKWWGKGFTEWTNVGKAKPSFSGHHQPHCPIHLGYYDLRLPSVLEEQAKMARSYGVNGFAYYFYWFAGKLLMEHPLEAMLANPKVDMPYCFIWANESWTRRWDGKENDVLVAQDHSLEDSRALLNYMRKFFDDPRYITVAGKPVFVVYRPGIIPDIAKTVEMWRQEAKAMGFPGIYLVSSQTFGHQDPREFGFDAAMEFPPHYSKGVDDIKHEFDDLDPTFSGRIYDYGQAVANAVVSAPMQYKVFPTATLSWDNTARLSTKADIAANFSVLLYSQWLSANAERVTKDKGLSADEKIIFVNAWNEWAEGTHLEPDQKHGFGYLEATRSVMIQYGPNATQFLNPQLPQKRNADMALILHLHFRDVWPEFEAAIRNIGDDTVDIYATATTADAAMLIAASFPNAYVELVDNRGRDIRPFLYIFGKIHAMGYDSICKVHGKKSSHRADGAMLRKAAFASLMQPTAINKLRSDPNVGLLVPEDSLIAHDEKNMAFNIAMTKEIAGSLGMHFTFGRFPAGSMFWFRPDALRPLLKIELHEFDVERGLLDGTMPHAIERLFANICEGQGFNVGTIGAGESRLGFEVI